MTSPENDDLDIEQRLSNVESEQSAIRQLFGSIATMNAVNTVDIYLFPGGLMPVRQTDGAIGFDAYARAIVDPLSKPTSEDPLRRTMADFNKYSGWENRVDERLTDWIVDDPNDDQHYSINLPPEERAMVGLGFATRMQYPLLYWVAPRSGFAARGITVSNSPGTVDPDYRGEAGALIENNSDDNFLISRHMRVVQVIFMLAAIPEITLVEQHVDLGDTKRSVGGFGSTGTHGGSI